MKSLDALIVRLQKERRDLCSEAMVEIKRRNGARPASFLFPVKSAPVSLVAC